MNVHAAPPTSTAEIEATLIALVTDRGPAKSICPSEVARALRADWQSLLTEVRRVACRLAAAGKIDILRKGQVVPPVGVKGVIRLRLAQMPMDGDTPE